MPIAYMMIFPTSAPGVVVMTPSGRLIVPPTDHAKTLSIEEKSMERINKEKRIIDILRL